jgi:predicted NAD/FAD-binding protein
LQKIESKTNVFISLNSTALLNNVLFVDNFSHPQFTIDAINAQQNLLSIQGKNNTWFAGAYWRYGFHEDGILSSINIAKTLNLIIPWEQHY